MNILTVDTSGSHLSLALLYRGEIFEHFLTIHFKHAEFLLSGIELLFQVSGISHNEIQLIGCSRGPGSFTGLRIGVVTVKALSIAWNVPLVFISSLAVYGYRKFLDNKDCLSVVDARKSRFYIAYYQDSQLLGYEYDLTVKEVEEKFLLNRSIGEFLMLTGPGAGLLYKEVLNKNHAILDPLFIKGRTQEMLFLTQEKFEKDGPCLDQEGPNYLRESNAELTCSVFGNKFRIEKAN